MIFVVVVVIFVIFFFKFTSIPWVLSVCDWGQGKPLKKMLRPLSKNLLA